MLPGVPHVLLARSLSENERRTTLAGTIEMRYSQALEDQPLECNEARINIVLCALRQALFAAFACFRGSSFLPSAGDQLNHTKTFAIQNWLFSQMN
jgi:hypothetical protein